jgi:hypothetical protein
MKRKLINWNGIMKKISQRNCYDMLRYVLLCDWVITANLKKKSH